MSCKWDDDRPWHEVTPPQCPHLLQVVRNDIKDSTIKPVLTFDVLFGDVR